MRLYYPGVAKRFDECAAWHGKQNFGIAPHFGYSWNFCINAPFPGQERVHCRPHADVKNFVGGSVLCSFSATLMVSVFFHSHSAHIFFLSDPFDDNEYSWLAIWELNIVVQLPPGVVGLYPSSLLYHFNVDISGESGYFRH